ncbi:MULTISPECIES: copper homeostasis periplasmic binding protein CopC [unclassified Pseudomonas]|jgi:methionine-rich copper-binding protein CopC|uniref:copper homeostasis periplasmic binding protein CopC n=1 Tax=unclassified Pseudomonas TaxID=196821 RepID=UPI00028922FD|nr:MULTISPECIES: copper homeostasis periplasmic binding protein CopC [unclassified Pseudomonas]QJI39017.1 copper homeostasis periplasmic binding protein CopC [Pseudomonas sp. ADAK13]
MLIKKTLTTVALLASLLGASAAFAHAHLKSAEPAADTSVTAPKDLRLTFSEGVEATFTRVSLSKDGTEVAIKGLETPDADKKVLVVTPAAPLAAGTYKVVWNAVSVDTHKSNGEYSFKVGQ